MAIESCISDWDVPLTKLRRCSGKRQRISSEANMTISELGTDLLVQILIRLPNPRSSYQCKLVCKRWRSLISSPRFNRRFVSHHLTRNHPHMPLDPYELKSIILSFLPPMPSTVGDALRVLDCNKDLVLCGFWDVDCDDGERCRSYLVCNPFTKQWMALPLAPRKHVGYMSTAARLVCESRNSNKLDLGGDDQEAAFYSEYRFRVVCIYQVDRPNVAINLDLFCSESGEWIKEAVVCDRHYIFGIKGIISCNGKLFWKYKSVYSQPTSLDLVAVFNPFRLDMPPTSIDVSPFLVYPNWFISASQGVLHVIAMENKTVPVRSSIWRLEEDGKSWRKQYEGLVNETSKCCNYDVEACYRPLLHAHNPEIIFFNPVCSEEKNAILSCDLRTGELEFFAKVEGKPDVYQLQVFQPRVSCWATPIPRYDELRGMYDGSYSFWVQSGSESKTHSLPPSLNVCKDEVMESAFYEDYIECVTEEATRDLVAEIIQRRKKKIRNEIVIRDRQLTRFPFDKELDGLKTILTDIEAEVGAIAKWKEELKQRLLSKTPAEFPYPPVSIKSVSTRNMVVPSRKRKMGGIVIRERKQPCFPDDKEAGMVTLGKRKEGLKQRRVCQTSAELFYPPVSMESVSMEVTTTNMVVPSRKRKIGGGMVIRERKQPRFLHDKEELADLKDVESYMAAIGNPKDVKQGVYCETSAELPHPLGLPRFDDLDTRSISIEDREKRMLAILQEITDQ